jgi:hypothetical protein
MVMLDGWGRDIIFDGTGGQPITARLSRRRSYYPAMETSKAPRPGSVAHAAGRRRGAALYFAIFPAMQGNLIVLNVIGFRGLLNYKLTEDGAGLKSEEVPPIPQSADENFRPVDAEVGPDGALHFADWQPDHRPYATQPARHDARPGARARLSVTFPGRPLLTPCQDRRRTHPGAARGTQGAGRSRAIPREDRALGA